MKSAYIHIPFCDNICSYCDFCKIKYKKEWTAEYLNSLENEINSKIVKKIIQKLIRKKK